MPTVATTNIGPCDCCGGCEVAPDLTVTLSDVDANVCGGCIDRAGSASDVSHSSASVDGSYFITGATDSLSLGSCHYSHQEDLSPSAIYTANFHTTTDGSCSGGSASSSSVLLINVFVESSDTVRPIRGVTISCVANSTLFQFFWWSWVPNGLVGAAYGDTLASNGNGADQSCATPSTFRVSGNLPRVVVSLTP